MMSKIIYCAACDTDIEWSHPWEPTPRSLCGNCGVMLNAAAASRARNPPRHHAGQMFKAGLKVSPTAKARAAALGGKP